MSQHTANDMRVIAELLDAITKFQSDFSHSLNLTGTLNVLDSDQDLERGQLRVSDEGCYYVPTTRETKENE
jgi:hypothetical protein